MNIFESKGAVSPLLILRPIFILIIIVAFFIFYNSFLVDRSLESLRFSLSSIANAETVGLVSYVGPLVQAQFIGELSSPELNTEELMRLQYSADVIETSPGGRKTADVVSIMQEIINKRERQRNVILRNFDKLNSFLLMLFKGGPPALRREAGVLDIDPAIMEEINSYENKGEFSQAIKLYIDTIAKYPVYVQTPTLMLRLSYLLHKLGRFEQAKVIYNDVISKFPGAAESKIAGELLGKIGKRAELEDEVKEIISNLAKTEDKKTRQKLYYQLGLIELAGLNLQSAKENLAQAASILPDTDITTQSYLRLGICERLLGDADASIEAFNKATQITKSTELKAQSEYQLVQSYRQKGEYKEAASTLDDIAKEQEDIDKKSLLLFLKGSILLYDEKDVSEAKEVFDELMRRYSARALVSPTGESSFVDFIKKHVDLNILARRPEELDKILEKAWVEAILPKKVLKIIETNSGRAADSLVQTMVEVAKLKEQNLKEGSYLEIEFTEEKINNFIKRALPATGRIAFSDIDIRFEGDQKLAISITIGQNGMPIKVFASGQFKLLSIAKAPFWELAAERANILVFLVENCKVGNIPVSPEIMNPIFKPALQCFNESFPLDIEKFELSRDSVKVAGLVRADFVRKLQATPSAGRMVSERKTAELLKGLSVRKLSEDGIQ